MQPIETNRNIEQKMKMFKKKKKSRSRKKKYGAEPGSRTTGENEKKMRHVHMGLVFSVLCVPGHLHVGGVWVTLAGKDELSDG